MTGTVPDDIAREKQHSLAAQLATAESALAQLSTDRDSQATTLQTVLQLVEHCGPTYARSDAAGRRDYNQAWFEALYLDADDDDRPAVARVRRTPLLATLQAHRAAGLTETVTRVQKCRRGVGPGGIEHVGVCNVELVVELRGIEPLTYSMRTSRATNCATAPCPPFRPDATTLSAPHSPAARR